MVFYVQLLLAILIHFNIKYCVNIYCENEREEKQEKERWANIDSWVA